MVQGETVEAVDRSEGADRSERSERRRAAGGSHVRRRRFGPWSVGVIVVSLIAGGLFALSAQTSGGRPLRADRADQASLLRQADQRNAETKARVNALEQLNEQRSAQLAQVDGQLKGLRSQIDALAPQAGFAAVTGPTLQVTLDDAPRGQPVPDGIPPDYLVVHQQDVQAVVNALWHGGAEAMMLMDQRVVATSAVRCVGNTLILQGQVYSPPYKIQAIGDIATMKAALAASPEVSIYQEFVKIVHLTYEVDELGQTTFPKYDGGTTLSYATPAPAGPASRPSDAVPDKASPSASATPSVGASGNG